MSRRHAAEKREILTESRVFQRRDDVTCNLFLTSAFLCHTSNDVVYDS